MFNEDWIQATLADKGWRINPDDEASSPSLLSLTINGKARVGLDNPRISHYPAVRDHHQWFRNDKGGVAGLLVCPFGYPIQEAMAMAYDWCLTFTVIQPSPYKLNPDATTGFLFTSILNEYDIDDFRRLCSPFKELAEPPRQAMAAAKAIARQFGNYPYPKLKEHSA